MKCSTLLFGDCLEKMKDIPDKSIDFILTDLPYNTTTLEWDEIVPFDKLWEQYNRIIKPNGAIALFGQEPFSSYLRMSNIKDYKFDWYWEKERLTNISQVKRRAGKTVETISMFYKKQPIYNPQFFDMMENQEQIRLRMENWVFLQIISVKKSLNIKIMV